MKKPITLLLLLSAGGLLASCGGRIDNTAPDYSGPYKITSSSSSSSEEKTSEISSSEKVEGSSEVISSEAVSSEIISSQSVSESISSESVSESGSVSESVPEVEAHGPEGSTAASWYIVGEGSLWGEDGWSTEGGIQLFTNPGSETDKGCILSLTFEQGDKFKVTDGTDWFGYDKVSQSTDGEVPNAGVTAFSDDGTENHNILCIASGTFDIYVNGEGQFWIQSSEGADAPVIPEVIESTGKGPEGSTAVSWYIVGEGSLWGANGWSTAGGVQLFSNPGSETDKGCILGLTFAEGDKFKVTDGEAWFGYATVNQSTDGEVPNAGVTAFSDDGTENHNIVCTTAGAYDIYVNGEGQFWIQAAAAE